MKYLIALAIVVSCMLFPSMLHHQEPNRVAAIDTQRQVNCLARNIYHEAHNQSYIGKLAVAQVTINRTKSAPFPSTICNVVYQKVNRTCQFSWVCAKVRQPTQKELDQYVSMAYDVIHGSQANVIGEALYYHAVYVPKAASKWFVKNLTVVARIDDHIFYKVRKS